MSAAPAHKAPKNVEQATALLDRVARIDGETATIEQNREAAIAATNAISDTLALPLIEERAKIVALLEPWWAKAGAGLLTGKRKSLVLGGCTIGTKAGRGKLGIPDAGEDAAIAALKALRWAKPLLRVTTSLDRAEIAKAITGKRAAALAELGFRNIPGAETFFVDRVAQPGTVTSAA